MCKIVPRNQALIVLQIFLFFLIPFSGYSQQKLAIKDIPALVQNNLPQLNAAKANAEASKSSIDFEKRSLMPDLTVAYQANIATFNNITGMSYPGLFLPISGPPSLNNEMNFIPGTAATAFLTWRPITFGQRKAAIDRATSLYNLANANYDEATFRFQFMAINTYLEAVYFKQLMNSGKANVNRFSSNLEQSLVLTKNGLKPGVDTIQLQSSMAQAKIDLLQSENNYKQKLIELNSLLGNTFRGTDLILTDTIFNLNKAVSLDTTLNFSVNPYYKSTKAQKDVSSAQLTEVNRLWRPRLDVWGNVYGRGSGVDALGNVNKAEGFNLTRQNVGVGLQLSFPILQFYQINAKKKQYQLQLDASEFSLKQAELDLNKQADIATQQYESNLAILENTAIRLKSAESAFNSLSISYEAGLVDFTRLVQAQYELQQAEVNNANAQLILQRSLLEISIAKGDLNLFLNR